MKLLNMRMVIASLVFVIIGGITLLNLSGNHGTPTGQVIYNTGFVWKQATFSIVRSGEWVNTDVRYAYDTKINSGSILKLESLENSVDFLIDAFRRDEEVVSMNVEFYISTNKFRLYAITKPISALHLSKIYLNKVECQFKGVDGYLCQFTYNERMHNYEGKGQLFTIVPYDRTPVLLYPKIRAVVEYRKPN